MVYEGKSLHLFIQNRKITLLKEIIAGLGFFCLFFGKEANDASDVISNSSLS